MRRSYYEIYLHLVWRTKNSEPYLSSEVEKEVCNIIQLKCKKFDTALLAVGNIEAKRAPFLKTGHSNRLGNNRSASPGLAGVDRTS
jgi:hypothetical protein